MKHFLFLIHFFVLTALQANIQDDRKELMDAERELFIANKQVQLLQEKFAIENQKMFNYGLKKAYQEAIVEYQEKAKKAQAVKDGVVVKQQERDRKMAEIERQIPMIDGDFHINVDLSQQIMNVYKGDTLVYSWFVSTAADGYFTPTGVFKPYHTEKMHFSKQFDNSPMPYSVFFKDGFAIHGTEWVRSLGCKASHGCVRLHPSNAFKLYNIVQKYGYNRITISIKS